MKYWENNRTQAEINFEIFAEQNKLNEKDQRYLSLSKEGK